MPYPITNFTTQKNGENSYAVNSDGMIVNSEVSINDQTDLHSIIRFNNSGCVYAITLTKHPGYFDYVVNVDAEGPQGFATGSGYLRFTDKTGDKYELSITSSSRSVHTVRYNSAQPEIVKIEWNNHAF